MSYYNWNKIVKNYNDSELKRIYREKFKEPQLKVDAVIAELINRGILSSDKKELIKIDNKNFIIDIKEVSGKTKSNKRLSNFVVIAVFIVLLIYVAAVVSSFLQYELLNDIKTGGFITQDVADNNDKREMFIGRITLITYIISSVLFLIWFYRSYDNLRKRISNVEHSQGWAVGAWFVPIISLFRPLNIMDEINKKTDIIIKNRGINIEQNKRSLIGLWWGLFIAQVYVGNILFRLSPEFNDIDGLILMTVSSLIVTLLGIILGLVTIKMIRNLIIKEEILFKSESKQDTR